MSVAALVTLVTLVALVALVTLVTLVACGERIAIGGVWRDGCAERTDCLDGTSTYDAATGSSYDDGSVGDGGDSFFDSWQEGPTDAGLPEASEIPMDGSAWDGFMPEG